MIWLILTLAVASGAFSLLNSAPSAPLLLVAGAAAVGVLLTWLRKPVWALYAAVFVVLLPTSLIPAEVNSFLNRSITVTALLVWLVDVILGRRKIVLTTSALWMLCFMLWAVVSILWAPYGNRGITVVQMYAMRFIVFIVLIANEIKVKKDLDGLMNTLALSGGLMVIVSWITLITRGYQVGSRLQVFDVNENYLGIFLLVTTSPVLWWAIRPESRFKPFKQFLAGIFLLSSIVLVGLSGSRGSAISLGVTLLVFLAWKQTRAWGLAGLVFLGLAAILAPFVFSTIVGRFLGAPGETLLSGRENLWPAAWQLISDHPLLGVGIGNSIYQVIPYLIHLGANISMQSGESIHNPILTVWAETGIPGLLLYLGILFSAVGSFVHQYVRFRKLNLQVLLPYFALVTAALSGYLTSWIKGGGLETDYFYFLLLALLLVPSRLWEGLNLDCPCFT